MKKILAVLSFAAFFAPAFAFAAGPATINLGTAANFAILAKTGISTTGVTSITGNIGVSPAAASYITGFSPVMDASNVFSKSSLVTGNIYAADYTPPTPAIMTTAVNDMQTAYTAASNPATPAGVGAGNLNVGAGTLSGNTFTPGVYTWGTDVNITGNITLSGSANDVWVFQISGNLTLSNGIHINLNGAQASNIFWQVAGQTTLGTTSIFNGNILDQTAIVLNNGATLNGRALAQTAVTLIADTVTSPLAAYGYNTVTMDNNVALNVGGIPLNVSGSTAAVGSITVNDSSFSFTLEPGSFIQVTAPNLNVLNTDTTIDIFANACNGSQSTLGYSGTSARTVTVTPSSTLCANTTGSGGGTSSGGGGSSGSVGTVTTTTTTPTTTTTTPTTTTTSPSSGLTGTQVSAILSLLTSFGADNATLMNVQEALNGTGGTTTTTTSSTSHSFARDLQMGSIGADVLALQQYLNAHGFMIAASGVGSAGHETTTFGGLTRAALIKFQKAHNITPIAGYFGAETRAVVGSNP